MKKSLRDIAAIQAGYQFRGRVVHDPTGGVPVIQMKDYDSLHGINVGGMATVRAENIPPACIARTGDVLFLARGQRLTAAVVNADAQGAIVSGYFFILRPEPDVADPGFLAWYINQPAFQTQLRAVAKGTDTPLVAKTDILNLTVELPPMNTQALVARLDDLSRRERCLLEAITEKRSDLIRALSQEAVRSGRGPERIRK
jgi:restriction endonuclease S subunit